MDGCVDVAPLFFSSFSFLLNWLRSNLLADEANAFWRQTSAFVPSNSHRIRHVILIVFFFRLDNSSAAAAAALVMCSSMWHLGRGGQFSLWSGSTTHARRKWRREMPSRDLYSTMGSLGSIHPLGHSFRTFRCAVLSRKKRKEKKIAIQCTTGLTVMHVHPAATNPRRNRKEVDEAIYDARSIHIRSSNNVWTAYLCFNVFISLRAKQSKAAAVGQNSTKEACKWSRRGEGHDYTSIWVRWRAHKKKRKKTVRDWKQLLVCCWSWNLVSAAACFLALFLSCSSRLYGYSLAGRRRRTLSISIKAGERRTGVDGYREEKDWGWEDLLLGCLPSSPVATTALLEVSSSSLHTHRHTHTGRLPMIVCYVSFFL